jgi:hypothetical protein
MLRRDDYHLHSCLTEDPDPLFSVKGDRIEQLRGFITAAPFPAREGVYAEVDERCHLKLLPGKLTWVWYDAGSHGFLDTVGRIGRKFDLPRIKLVEIIIRA